MLCVRGVEGMLETLRISKAGLAAQRPSYGWSLDAGGEPHSPLMARGALRTCGGPNIKVSANDLQNSVIFFSSWHAELVSPQ